MLTLKIAVNKKKTLEQVMSMSLDLPDKEYEMIELTGAWARERSIKERKLEHGIQSIYSLRGCSSNNFNPFIALKREIVMNMLVRF